MVMLPEQLPEKILEQVKLLSFRFFKIVEMLFAEPPDDRRKPFKVPAPSLLLSLLAAAAFLIALIASLYWLLITLAG